MSHHFLDPWVSAQVTLSQKTWVSPSERWETAGGQIMFQVSTPNGSSAPLRLFIGAHSLFSFVRFRLPIAIQIKPQEYEDLCQINRAGGVYAGNGCEVEVVSNEKLVY
jgi:hypothetical protein